MAGINPMTSGSAEESGGVLRLSGADHQEKVVLGVGQKECVACYTKAGHS